MNKSHNGEGSPHYHKRWRYRGHIFPAVSIANAIKELRPDAEILFVGAEGRMEMQRVPDAGYKIIGLPVAGFDRKRLWKNFAVIIKLLRSQLKALPHTERVSSSGSGRCRWLCQWPYVKSSRYDGSAYFDTGTELLCRRNKQAAGTKSLQDLCCV